MKKILAGTLVMFMLSTPITAEARTFHFHMSHLPHISTRHISIGHHSSIVHYPSLHFKHSKKY
jgi:hypothetical protein